MSSISNIHTACKDCVFALYKDITQIGCKLDKLTTWKDRGLKILEVYDEEKEFYVINNKKCPYKRNYKWGDKYTKDIQVEQIYKEVVLTYHAIIVSNNNITDIYRTIDDLMSQHIKPSFITIIYPYGGTILPDEIKDRMKLTSIPWKSQTIVNSDITIMSAIDTSISSCSSAYYAVFYAGLTIPQNMTKSVNNLVTQDIPFIMIEPTLDDNCKFIHTITHRVLKGNKVNSIEYKIQEYREHSLIKSMEDICKDEPC